MRVLLVLESVVDRVKGQTILWIYHCTIYLPMGHASNVSGNGICLFAHEFPAALDFQLYNESQALHNHAAE